MRHTSRFLLALSCAAVLTLTACSGGDTPNNGGSSSSRSPVGLRLNRSSSSRSLSSARSSVRSSVSSKARSSSSRSSSVRSGASSSHSATSSTSSTSSRRPFSLNTSSRSSASSQQGDAVAGAIKLHIDADRSEAHPADQVFYTISLRNTSTAPVSSFQVVFSFAPDQMTVTESDGQNQTDNIQWTIDSLQPNQKRALRVRATLSPTLQHGDFVRSNAIAIRDGVVEPTTATFEMSIIRALPPTGAGDGVGPLENTRRFLRPFSAEGGVPAIPAIVWTATILLGVGIGVQAGKRYL